MRKNTCRAINIKVSIYSWIFASLFISLSLTECILARGVWAIKREEYRVITSSRIEEPLSRVTSTVTVITGEEIKRQQARTVVEVLRNIPGIVVQNAGTLGEEANIRIRGAEFDQVLVLIDGIKVNSPLTGEFDFGDLPIDNIERIEVVRGAHSAFYGSEAIGGVVNIITKSGKKENEGLSFLAEGGNQETFRGILRTEGQKENFNYAATFSRSEVKGQFPRDAFRANNLVGQISLNPTSDSVLRLVSRYIGSSKELALSPAALITDADLRMGNRLALTRDPNRSLQRSSFFNHLFYRQRPSPRWNFELSLGWVEKGLKEDNPLDPPERQRERIISFTDFINTKDKRLILSTQHHLYLFTNNIFSLGLDYERERVNFHEWGNLESLGEGPSALMRFTETRDIGAFYAQNHFSWQERLFINAGLRLDYNKDFGTSLNPKVSLAYWIRPEATKLKASFGTGFRAPSFVELFTPTFGKRDLRPEKSRSFELGIEQRLWEDKLSIDFIYFNNHFTDLIFFDGKALSFVNKKEASVQGFETTLNWIPQKDLFFQLNYTWMDTEDKDTGKDLPLRPKHSWNFHLAYTWEDTLTTNLDINILSSQRQNFPHLIGLNGHPLGFRKSGYTRWNLTTTYKLPIRSLGLKGISLFNKINNLLDERDISEDGVFPNAGINFLVGIEAGF